MSNNPIYNQPLTVDQNYQQYHQGYPQSPYAQSGYTQPGYPDQPYQYPNYQGNTAQHDYSNSNSFTPRTEYSNTNYNYDMEHIQYQPMSLNNWNQIPNDPSPYSQMWESPQSFEPQNFSVNTKINKRYNDLGWMIAFWINFVVTVGVIIWLGVSYKNHIDDDYNPYPSPTPYPPYHSTKSDTEVTTRSSDSYTDDETEITNSDLLKIFGFGLAIAAVVNIFHYCYATFAPVFYIHAGLIVNIIFSILVTIIPVMNGNYYFIIFPIINLLLTICIYCCMKRYIKISAEIMRTTCKILCRYPSYFFLVFLESIWEIIICAAFAAAIYFVEATGVTYFIYIYLVFSYFWITITFGYVTYMIGAGLASSWYFLNNTSYFPSSPVLESFKRSMSTSFGSASLAGFLLAVVNTLRVLIESNTSNDSSSTAEMIMCVLRCIALCILNIIEACISFINRYALIYCATFGVPFKEGCRRWCELSCHKFVDVIMSGNCISTAITYNGLGFIVGAAILGYGVGYLVFKNTQLLDIGEIFTCVFAFCFTFSIFAIFMQPICTVSDTLLVCFAEEPSQMKTADNELYEDLKELYESELNRRLS